MATTKNRRMPVSWEIHPRSLYLIHEVLGNDEEGIKVELLAESTAPGRLTGHFRWAFGGGNVEASCAVGRIFDAGDAFWLDFNCRPDDITIRENNCAGPWEDLSEWIAKDRVKVLQNNEDARDTLLGKHLT